MVLFSYRVSATKSPVEDDSPSLQCTIDALSGLGAGLETLTRSGRKGMLEGNGDKCWCLTISRHVETGLSIDWLHSPVHLPA